MRELPQLTVLTENIADIFRIPLELPGINNPADSYRLYHPPIIAPTLAKGFTSKL
jgi:hypothetical protein